MSSAAFVSLFKNLPILYEQERKVYNNQIEELLSQIYLLRKSVSITRFEYYSLYILVFKLQKLVALNYKSKEWQIIKTKTHKIINELIYSENSSSFTGYLDIFKSILFDIKNYINRLIDGRISLLEKITNFEEFISNIIDDLILALSTSFSKDNYLGNLNSLFKNDFILMLEELYEFTKKRYYLTTHLPLINNPVIAFINAILEREIGVANIVISIDLLVVSSYLQIYPMDDISKIIKKMDIESQEKSKIIPSIFEIEDEKIHYKLSYIEEYFRDFNIKKIFFDCKSKSSKSVKKFENLVPQIKKLPKLLLSIESLYDISNSENSFFKKYFCIDAEPFTPSTILFNMCNFYFHKNIIVSSYIHSVSKLDYAKIFSFNIEFEILYTKLVNEISKKNQVNLELFNLLIDQMCNILNSFDSIYDNYIYNENTLQKSIEMGNLSEIYIIYNSYNHSLNYKKIQEEYREEKQNKVDYKGMIDGMSTAIKRKKISKATKLAKKMNILVLGEKYYSIPNLISFIETPCISSNMKTAITNILLNDNIDVLKRVLSLEEKYWSISND